MHPLGAERVGGQRRMIGPQQVRRLPLRAVAVTNTQATAPPAEPEGDPTEIPCSRLDRRRVDRRRRRRR